MGLVDYSDSDASEDETTTQNDSKAAATSSKQSFHKVVDRANPSKIKVSLPNTAAATVDDAALEDERPAKRVRTGGGGGLFSGLNSFLPAPKRSGGAVEANGSVGGKKLGLGRGLGSGISLRTGATPAFSREAPAPVADDSAPEVATGTRVTSESSAAAIAPMEQAEVKLVGKATMFRPLSVARKKQKVKKPLFVADSQSSSASAGQQTASHASEAAKPKMSLFSLNQDTTAPAYSNGEQRADTTAEIQDDEMQDDWSGYDAPPKQYQPQANQAPQTLDNIASELNLDAAAKRQLFGRRGRSSDAASINLVSFDTDAQYTANEQLRAAGEAVQHNVLRTVQPGKHSLRQLVSSASTQKEALEESWAAGRRNKKEAGNKYGW